MTISYNSVETSKLIRAELKTAFPKEKLSVRSDGNTIRIGWVDGVSKVRVAEITDKFSSVSFDGMQDMDVYTATTHKGEAVRFYNYTPYLYRDMTLEFATKALAMIAITNEYGAKGVSIKMNKYSGFAEFHEDDYCRRASFYADLNLISKSDFTNQAESISDQNNSILVSENEAKGGVEIRFKVKPLDHIRQQLKDNGFKWNRVQGCWYAKKSDLIVAFAHQLNEDTKQAQPDRIVDNEHPQIKAVLSPLQLMPSSEVIEPEVVEPEIFQSQWYPSETEIGLVNPTQDLNWQEIEASVMFPSLNKNNTIGEYEEQISEGKYQNTRTKLVEHWTIKPSQFKIFTHALLSDYNFLDGKGGCDSDYDLQGKDFYRCSKVEIEAWRKLSYTIGILVTSEDNAIVIDPQCYSYARYVGLLNEKNLSVVLADVRQSSHQSNVIDIRSRRQLPEVPNYQVITEAISIIPVLFPRRSHWEIIPNPPVILKQLCLL